MTSPPDDAPPPPEGAAEAPAWRDRRGAWARRVAARAPIGALPPGRPLGPVALTIEGASKRVGRHLALDGVEAAFRIGELVMIRGARGSGKTVLARLLAGQTLPTGGRIRRLGPAAPLVGSNWGFVGEAPTRLGLELRAASYGIALRDYEAALAAILHDPSGLRGTFTRLNGRDRQLLLFASAYLIPATVYVSDGQLLPAEKTAEARLAPLYIAVRARAAVIWIADEKTPGRRFGPDRILRLANGCLTPEE